MGTLKNRLNETVHLSTQNIRLILRLRIYIKICALKNVCLDIREDIAKNIRLACKSNYYNKETTTETYRFNVYLVLILNTFSITKFCEVLSYHRTTCTYCPVSQV